MSKQERIEVIFKHLNNIQQAHDWCRANFPEFLGGKEELSLVETANQQFLHSKLLPALEVIYGKLEELGVSRESTASLFILGTADVRQLAEQFGR